MRLLVTSTILTRKSSDYKTIFISIWLWSNVWFSGVSTYDKSYLLWKNGEKIASFAPFEYDVLFKRGVPWSAPNISFRRGKKFKILDISMILSLKKSYLFLKIYYVLQRTSNVTHITTIAIQKTKTWEVSLKKVRKIMKPNRTIWETFYCEILKLYLYHSQFV